MRVYVRREEASERIMNESNMPTDDCMEITLTV